MWQVKNRERPRAAKKPGEQKQSNAGFASIVIQLMENTP